MNPFADGNHRDTAARRQSAPVRCLWQLCLCLGVLCGLASAAPQDYFAIEVLDEQTGRGVPMVELETTNHIKLLTDSAGVAAFFEPGLMNQKVFFYVRSHGYEFEKDGFGFAGTALDVVPGGKATLKIKRINIAQRLYRTTGGGIYADSVLLGRTPPIKQPLLNAQVLGLDSVQSAVYRDRIYWFWGDTNRPSYPLGNFHTTGATSLLPGKGGLDPDVGVDLEYFTNADGFVQRMMPMPEGTPGPVWTDAVFTVNDDTGRERLVANFTRVASIAERLERGIMVFDDDNSRFEKVCNIPLEEPLGPQGQAVATKILIDGVNYQYFCHWGPTNIRVRADWKSVIDPAAYEAYTPIAPGGRFAGKDTPLDRDASGKLRWDWKKNTATLSNREQKELIDAGLMKPEESPHYLVNVLDNTPVTLHSATVAFNRFRQRWVLIGLEIDGTSKLGEVWYSEARDPEGPWRFGIKIVTHNRYTFYNPRHHPFLDTAGGRYIHFEGTFANSLAGHEQTTPRYEYNQIMYRLDLADPRLKPVADAVDAPAR